MIDDEDDILHKYKLGDTIKCYHNNTLRTGTILRLFTLIRYENDTEDYINNQNWYALINGPHECIPSYYVKGYNFQEWVEETDIIDDEAKLRIVSIRDI